MWIWQHQKWPAFYYRSDEIVPVLEKTLKAVSPLILLAHELAQETQLHFESRVLFSETLATAKIEGELLDRESVRSSIAHRLGVGNITHTSKNVTAFVDILLEAVRFSDQPLTELQLLEWHRMMFADKPLIGSFHVGYYRNAVMQVISGRFGKQIVHFEAPCATRAAIQSEMRQFFQWLNQSNIRSFYIKAAIAKFYFVTLHPFDDGNGRLSRIIAERCLAQADATQLRLYSISHQIEKNKQAYYELLERCQKGSLDITDWIIWFLQQVTAAAHLSLDHLAKIRLTTLFWDKYRLIAFNTRQKKIIATLIRNRRF